MLKTILRPISIFATFIAIFIAMKAMFYFANGAVLDGIGISGLCASVWHGLKMDCSMAAYLTVVPSLLAISGIWLKSSKIGIAGKIYYWIIGYAVAVICVLDMALYPFWGFKLDATPLFYFFSSPESAFASVSWEFIAIGIASVLLIGFCFAKSLIAVWTAKCFMPRVMTHKVWRTVLLSVFTLLLFIPMRGGVTVSTMNLSMSYFSDDQRLNHLAVNPVFSLMHSLTHQSNLSSQFHYMDDEEAERILSDFETSTISGDSIPRLSLNKANPDIYLIILESFSSHLFPSLDGESIAVNLDSIAREGVLFNNIYANSFRTDRGLTAILSAYPGMPSTSIMKYVEKTDNLPSIPKTLKGNGYFLEYYYGGDINFTNMNAYLMSAGFDKIVKDSDFPVSQRLSKWGVHDDKLLDYTYQQIATPKKSPVFRVIQTSSSHEPFEVPYSNPAFQNERANAFAYTDSVVASFICKLKQDRGRWDNSLVILIPDHYGCYPENLEDVGGRHQIPLIITGGAINEKGVMVPTIGSQIDFAATLFALLGISSEDFPFSKDLMDAGTPHYAFFCNPDYAAIATQSGVEKVDVNNPSGDSARHSDAIRAYLQLLYRDFDRR